MHVEPVLQHVPELFHPLWVFVAPRLDLSGKLGNPACLIHLQGRDQVRLGERTLQSRLWELWQIGGSLEAMRFP